MATGSRDEQELRKPPGSGLQTSGSTLIYVSRSPFVGGAERNLLRVTRAMDRSRFTPHIIAGCEGDFPSALEAAGESFDRIAQPDPHRMWPFPFLLSVTRLALAYRQLRGVLVHANDIAGFPASGLAARWLGLPRVCHIRFSYPASGIRWHLKYGFEFAVFSSHYMKSYVQDQCPDLFPDHRCRVIHDGFEARPEPQPEAVAQLATNLGIDLDTEVIAFFGQVIPIKGVREFLLMAQKVSAARPEALFLIVGDDKQAGVSYRVEMERFAAQLGISQICRFLGFRSDVWELLHLCELVVIPSREEPLGLVAMEAGAAGRPVVASRIGGLPEIVVDHETGLLEEPRNPAGLADAVMRLIVNPETGRKMGEQARERIAAHFSLAVQARELLSLYDELLAGGRVKTTSEP